MKGRHLDKYMPEVVDGLDAPVGKLTSASSVLDRRDAERVPLDAAVSYVSDARMGLTRGEGHLEDLSKTGCKIIGPLLMVGTLATLVIHVNDDKPPLCLSGVEVTWTNGDSFGVRFPKLKAEDRQRLQELVLRFATFKGRSEDHTAFRLA
jgi:PilZ domain